MSTLLWPIKDSLVRYVEGLPDGAIQVDGGASTGPGGFAFPGDGRRFLGSVTLLGHHGMMRVVLRNPALVETGAGWVLEIADPDDPASHLLFATMASFDGALGRGLALSSNGADLFFGPYEKGTPLSDLAVQPGRS